VVIAGVFVSRHRAEPALSRRPFFSRSCQPYYKSLMIKRGSLLYLPCTSSTYLPTWCADCSRRVATVRRRRRHPDSHSLAGLHTYFFDQNILGAKFASGRRAAKEKRDGLRLRLHNLHRAIFSTLAYHTTSIIKFSPRGSNPPRTMHPLR
jgi:hypothetical protein